MDLLFQYHTATKYADPFMGQNAFLVRMKWERIKSWFT